MSLQTINPSTNKTVMSFEEMTNKSVDSNAAVAQVGFSDWKETYPEHFVVEGKHLTDETGLNTYGPHQIEIITYFGLNGNTKPEENGVVYLIETFDGSKGILIYRYDVFTDCRVYDFLKEYADYKYRLYKGYPEIHASNIPHYR